MGARSCSQSAASSHRKCLWGCALLVTLRTHTRVNPAPCPEGGEAQGDPIPRACSRAGCAAETKCDADGAAGGLEQNGTGQQQGAMGHEQAVHAQAPSRKSDGAVARKAKATNHHQCQQLGPQLCYGPWFAFIFLFSGCLSAIPPFRHSALRLRAKLEELQPSKDGGWAVGLLASFPFLSRRPRPR